MATFDEIYIDQGATFSKNITMTDVTTNTSINIIGYSVTAQLRRSYYSVNASANLVCSIVDGANGVINLSLPSANTINIPANRYLFDVYALSTSNVKSRILEGIITVTPGVTR